MIRFLLVVLTCLLVMPFAVFAQDTLPPCTHAQSQATYVVLEANSFVADFQNAAKVIANDADVTEIPHDGFLLLDALQHKWWAEIVPALPDCEQAQRLALIGGRMLDEMLIGLSISHWAEASANDSLADSITQHKDATLELNVQLAEITEELGAIQPDGLAAAAEQAAATPTAIATE